MDRRQIEAFKRLVDQLEAGSDAAFSGDAPDAEAARFARALAASLPELASRPRDRSACFTFDRLGALVEQQREQGARWAMPDHLASCPLCLETFTLLQQPRPEVRAAAYERFMAIGQGGAPHADVPPQGDVPQPMTLATARAAAPGGQRGWRRWPAAAAMAALVMLAAGAWYAWAPQAVPLRFERGALVVQGGTQSDGVLQAGAMAVAPERVEAVLADGSQLAIDMGTQFSMDRQRLGGVRLHLAEGNVAATVAPQRRGQRFTVATPVGDAVVLGTRLQVNCEQERAQVFETDGDTNPRESVQDITVTRVTVSEGVVLVRNDHQQARITAGWQAVLREDQAHIELTEIQP